jgi:small subunit ribosomal protein S20
VANTKSAKKRVLQNETRRKHNASLKSVYRNHIKKVETEILANKKEEALEKLKELIPVIDKMVTKKVLEKNKAARHKSRLNAKVKKLA